MCFGNRLPRQSADWLAMTGFFDSLCQREALTEGLSLPGGTEPRPYTRLPIAFAPSVRADVGIRPYEITGGVCVIRTGRQSRPPLHPVSRRQNISNQRPKAATYLCRFAAKARFDNRPPPVGVSKEGGPQPSLFGRSRIGDFQGGRKIETSFPLEWRFWLLLSLLTKVTHRRQKEKGRKESNPPEATEKEPKNGPVFPPGRP